MVRVISVSTSERTLLKGFTGSVADLAFAHLNSSQLACLDEAGNLFVWRLALVNGKIQYPFPGVGWETEERWVGLELPDIPHHPPVQPLTPCSEKRSWSTSSSQRVHH